MLVVQIRDRGLSAVFLSTGLTFQGEFVLVDATGVKHRFRIADIIEIIPVCDAEACRDFVLARRSSTSRGPARADARCRFVAGRGEPAAIASVKRVRARERDRPRTWPTAPLQPRILSHAHAFVSPPGRRDARVFISLSEAPHRKISVALTTQPIVCVPMSYNRNGYGGHLFRHALDRPTSPVPVRTGRQLPRERNVPA